MPLCVTLSAVVAPKVRARPRYRINGRYTVDSIEGRMDGVGRRDIHCFLYLCEVTVSASYNRATNDI